MCSRIFLHGLIIVAVFSLSHSYAQEVDPNKKAQNCGIENCHGLKIICGPNIPTMCNAMYGIGDFCRQYAQCEIINEKCQLVTNETFNLCKSCIEDCNRLVIENPNDIFNCELKCREKLKNK